MKFGPQMKAIDFPCYLIFDLHMKRFGFLQYKKFDSLKEAKRVLKAVGKALSCKTNWDIWLDIWTAIDMAKDSWKTAVVAGEICRNAVDFVAIVHCKFDSRRCTKSSVSRL